MKIGILLICTGEKYHPYIDPLIESARKHLLPNHEKDFLLWTDDVQPHDAITIPAEHQGMPWATLMRYHLFLSQPELLKKYDYLFYCDVDMLFVDTVGDEILSPLTATEHPGYAYGETNRRIYTRPVEPNPESAAYIRQPEYYYAGGFQGGKTETFIDAMLSMRAAIDDDFKINYIARWHDESHWNKYLWNNPPATVLNPAYCYPDQCLEGNEFFNPPIKDFYTKVWGQDFKPKLLCRTKAFAFSKDAAKDMNNIMKSL